MVPHPLITEGSERGHPQVKPQAAPLHHLKTLSDQQQLATLTAPVSSIFYFKDQ